MAEIKPVCCSCGADARIRHRDPYVWVECKKKCGMYSGYFVKCLSDDVKAERDAIKAWNMVVKYDGRTKHMDKN